MAATYDVLAIGNAIVDVLAHAEESFLAERGMPKGGMVLIDSDQADALYREMGPAVESSGGSAANTVAGIASLGGSAAFIGKVADDILGRVFRHDITAIGAHYTTESLVGGAPTARCLVLITPDAERTMSTYLGACTALTPEDIDEDLVRASAVTYIEGYLWDQPHAKDAIVRAACAAKEAKRKVSLSLSDPFCVERHREEFLELIDGFVDILFANEAELKALYELDDFDAAVAQVRGHAEVAAVTRGAKGSVVITGGDVLAVPVDAVDRVVDTTGAGDLYAAGFLFGYTRGYELAECARIGGIAAGEVISHVGPRPEKPLADLIKERLAV
ncbi:MAG: carbohydrate kinase [Rhodospirillaceae bacterium BRH_c57]|nr:MAG: carbohydrate kinase [Rhodospirillaceae bacterium BRH_c57]